MRGRVHESDRLLAQYKKLCNEVKASARKDKEEWLEKQCKDIEKSMEQNKSKEVYELVKNVSKSWKQRITAIKSEAFEIVDSDG